MCEFDAHPSPIFATHNAMEKGYRTGHAVLVSNPVLHHGKWAWVVGSFTVKARSPISQNFDKEVSHATSTLGEAKASVPFREGDQNGESKARG